MLLKLFIIFIIISIFFFIINLLISKKEKSAFRKFISVLSALSLIFSVVFAILHLKVNSIQLFNNIKKYDIEQTYTQTLEKTNAQKAYPYLPCELFTENGNLYFSNLKNDIFILSNESGEYTSRTVANNTVYIGGGKTLKATLTASGDLILDGYMLYSNYEDKHIEFNNKTIAKGIVSCGVTSNSLVYVTESGKLYGMGFNAYGQLGDSTTKNKPSPILIKDGVFKAEVSDTHMMFIDKYGTLYAVGDNSCSQLGNKTAVSSTEIIRIMQGVKDIKLGSYFSLVLSVNGEVYTAGINNCGQLGSGGVESRAELIPTLSGVEKIDVNGNTCAALTYDGKVYVWGDNSQNQISESDNLKLTTPTLLLENVYDFVLTDNGIALLTKNREIYTTNSAGALVLALNLNANVPEQYIEKNSIGVEELPVQA